jgi:hypothetical protein
VATTEPSYVKAGTEALVTDREKLQTLVNNASDSQKNTLKNLGLINEKHQIKPYLLNRSDLFTKIGKEIEEAMKSGKDQMAVTMEVMKKYQDELRKLA